MAQVIQNQVHNFGFRKELPTGRRQIQIDPNTLVNAWNNPNYSRSRDPKRALWSLCSRRRPMKDVARRLLPVRSLQRLSAPSLVLVLLRRAMVRLRPMTDENQCDRQSQ